MKSKALLPGSYDPLTRGHIEVVRRALEHFDEVYVVIFVNPDKETLFTKEERLLMLRAAFDGNARVITDIDCGLVADYAARNGISLLIKGVRNEQDFTYELPMADHHRTKCALDTLFLPCEPKWREISSSAVRHALQHNLPTDSLLTPEVERAMRHILQTR